MLTNKLHEIGRQLNLAVHGVMGLNDLTPKFISCPADMRGYRGTDKGYYLLKLWRSFPPEYHRATPHLHFAPRGMSIFWRFLRYNQNIHTLTLYDNIILYTSYSNVIIYIYYMLTSTNYLIYRPEFVKSWPVPLSADALSLFTSLSPDSNKQNEKVKKATESLINVCINYGYYYS